MSRWHPTLSAHVARAQGGRWGRRARERRRYFVGWLGKKESVKERSLNGSRIRIIGCDRERLGFLSRPRLLSYF